MQTGLKPRRTSPPYIGLDLLRGGASLMVVLYHARIGSFVEFGALPHEQQNFLALLLFGSIRLGDEAVLAFFVLSGSLVGGQIIRKVQHSTFDIRTYAIDRATRILLPLIPVCVLTAALSVFVFNTDVGCWVLVANMIGLNEVIAPTLQYNIPLWSLAYEIWFYVIGGAAAYLLTRRSILALLVLGVGSTIFSVLDASLLIYWAFGAVVVTLAQGRRGAQLFAVGIALAIAGTALLELSTSRGSSFQPILTLPAGISRSLFCIGIALSLPFLCSETAENALSPMRIMARPLSEFSYTLYLTHYPTLRLLDLVFPKADSINVSSASLFVARIIISIATAIALYWCFERNTMRLRAWFMSRARSVTIRPGAGASLPVNPQAASRWRHIKGARNQ
jgi:peptidoglycan/LPS O-acetylase OafA/YrhL